MTPPGSANARSLVLIVDSDATRAARLRGKLTGLPCDIAELRSGNDALGRCVGSDDIAMLLMASDLADISSFEVVELLKSELSTRHIPVIVVAESDDPHDRRRALAAGTCDYLVRPLDRASLVAKASTFLDLHLRQHHLRVQLARSEAMRLFAKDSETRLRLALDDAPIPIMVHAEDGEIFMMSRMWVGIPGYLRGEVHNLDSWIRRAHPDDAQRAWAHFAAARENRQAEFEVHAADGRILTWDISSGPLAPLPDGRQLVISMALDISERKRYETAITQAKLEAERANQAKSRFLAAASHDLRQPLQGLQMYFEVLASGLPDRKHPAVVGVYSCAELLREQLNSLLDIAKLDSGAVEPNVTQCQLGEVMRKVVASQFLTANAKGIRLRMVSTAAVVATDPVLFERVLLNLVSNAVKYTERGRVLIGCRRRAGRLAVEVWDTGAGIDQKHREEIFEEFFQINNPSRDRAKGSGLGLAIVQRVAKALDLRVAVSSQLGRGSTFTVEFPAATPIQSEAAPGVRQQLRSEAAPLQANNVGLRQ